MAHIFITGSTDGLGRSAAQSGSSMAVIRWSSTRGHPIARRRSPSSGLAGSTVVVGDLRSGDETQSVSEQVNAIGRMDAVIHNAGIYSEKQPRFDPEGHATILAVNILAPYMLTALIERPHRLIYLSSGLHRGGAGALHDIDWSKRPWDTARAYAESKLQVVALAFALAQALAERPVQRCRSGLGANENGRRQGAPVDLDTGTADADWLAVSEEIRRQGQWPLLASPPAGAASQGSHRSRLSGPAHRNAQ